MDPAPRRGPNILVERLRHELRFWLGLAGVFATSTMLLLTAWVAVAQVALGWEAGLIVSGSMAPAIRPGDIVLFDPGLDDPGVHSVVRYRAPDGSTIVHRVVEVRPEGLVTRGDANRVNDSTLQDPDRLLGVGVAVVPLVGQPLQWFRTGAWAHLLALASLVAVGLALRRGGVLSNDPWAEQNTGRPVLYGPFTASLLARESTSASFIPEEVTQELRRAGVEFRLERIVPAS